MRTGITGTSKAASWLSTAVLCLLVPLGVWDVASREFGLPYMPGASDLPALVLAAIVFLAWPGVESNSSHVSSTLLVDRLPARVAALVVAVGQALACGLVAVLLVATIQRAQRSIEIGETTIGVDELPVWPFRVLMAVGLGLLLLQMVVTLIRLATEARALRTRDGANEGVAR